MGEHTVTITFEDGFPRYTFTCNAGPEGLCHARYTCDCETWYDHSIRNGVPAHRPDPFDEELWHAGVFDADECFHKPWFDEACEESLNGAVTVSVKPVRDGEFWTFNILPPSDAERKLAAVRGLRDATEALCQPPVPTDDDPMSQGAWAARREVVDALNALLDCEVE